MKPSRATAFLWRVASPIVWPFVLVYATGVRLKNAAYDLRLSKARRLSWPVVSIGNLSVGGTGKTPVAILLAGLLEAHGWSVDVLSRGYGRNGRAVVRVDPHGHAGMFGDEPLLMARRGVAVYVGADRYRAGLLSEQNAQANPDRGSGLHILDDGFQHRGLHRAVDIVLLQRADLEDDMLPLGRLREPLSALVRADICVLRSEDFDLKDRVLRLMGQTDPQRVWIVERRTVLPQPVSSHSAGSAIAFCAIGDPRGFFEGLRRSGIQVSEEISFRDHHVFTEKDIQRLNAAAKRSSAQCFITTEKDGMRLSGNLRAELELESPLIIAGLEVSLHNEARSIAVLESMLTAPKSQPLQPEQHNVR